jgi:hypothetical protein
LGGKGTDYTSFYTRIIGQDIFLGNTLNFINYSGKGKVEWIGNFETFNFPRSNSVAAGNTILSVEYITLGDRKGNASKVGFIEYSGELPPGLKAGDVFNLIYADTLLNAMAGNVVEGVDFISGNVTAKWGSLFAQTIGVSLTDHGIEAVVLQSCTPHLPSDGKSNEYVLINDGANAPRLYAGGGDKADSNHMVVDTTTVTSGGYAGCGTVSANDTVLFRSKVTGASLGGYVTTISGDIAAKAGYV